MRTLSLLVLIALAASMNAQKGMFQTLEEKGAEAVYTNISVDDNDGDGLFKVPPLLLNKSIILPLF